MALVLNSFPTQYSSAHSDLLFTVYEATKATDPVTYPNYKYVADVYIGGVMVERIKAVPNPSNYRGIFNIGFVVRNYVAAQLSLSAGIIAQQMGSGSFYVDVQVKFGEEYSFTTYTDLLVDSSRRFYNHYEKQITSVQMVLANQVDAPASNRPYLNTVMLEDTETLVPFFSTASAITVSITAHTLSGSATVGGSITVTPGSLQLLNLSPTAINNDYPATIDEDTVYYTVTLNSILSLKFTLIDECKFTPYKIVFLNQFGGYESFTFYKLSRTTYEGEKKTFAQLPYRVDGSGAVSYNTNSVVHDTVTTYASRYKKKTKVYSDSLTDEQWAWLHELVFSQQVYVKEGSFFVPVSITDTNYEQKKWINDKLQPLQIELEYGVDLNTQSR